MLRIVLDNDRQPSGIFVPIEDFDMLKPGLKVHSLIYELIDELSVPEEERKTRQRRKTDDELTPEEREISEQYRREDYYIRCFASGNPVYYRDERCRKPTHLIRAETDGSETLVQYDWETKTCKEIHSLASSGKGKYAYLLYDIRYIELRPTNEKRTDETD